MNPEATDIAAKNRRNSQRSTGPKSAVGKAASSRNATKHAILANSLVVNGEEPDRAGELIAACTQELTLVGEIGRELANGLVLGLQQEQRLAKHEEALIEKAKAEAEDPDRYPETKELQQLREHLAVSQQLHAVVSGAEFLSSDPSISETQTFIDGIAQAVAGCLTGTEGVHPASALIVELQDELRRLRQKSGDVSLLLVGLGRVTKIHVDFILQRMIAVEKKRQGKIDMAKRLAEIPSDGDVKRLSRYRTMIDKALQNRLELAERFRNLLKPSE